MNQVFVGADIFQWHSTEPRYLRSRSYIEFIAGVVRDSRNCGYSYQDIASALGLVGAAEAVAYDLGVILVEDVGAVDVAIDEVISSGVKPVVDFRGGKKSALEAIVGIVMRRSKGLDAVKVRERLIEKLKTI